MKLFTVGVTGTRSGMNAEQATKFEQYLKWWSTDGTPHCPLTLELIHGEARGVDTQAATSGSHKAALGTLMITQRRKAQRLS